MKFSHALPYLLSGLYCLLLALSDARQESAKLFEQGKIWGGPHSAAPLVDLSGHNMMLLIGLAAVGGGLIVLGCQKIRATPFAMRKSSAATK